MAGRFLLAWLVAAFSTIVIAVLFQTQNVIARLNGIGAEIGFGQRLTMSAYDIYRLGSLYGIFILAATLVAFLVGWGLYRWAKFGFRTVFVVAGAVAMLVMLLSMKQAFFGVHLIAGARDMVGIGMQMAAGAIGGLIFATIFTRLTRPEAQSGG